MCAALITAVTMMVPRVWLWSGIKLKLIKNHWTYCDSVLCRAEWVCDMRDIRFNFFFIPTFNKNNIRFLYLIFNFSSSALTPPSPPPRPPYQQIGFYHFHIILRINFYSLSEFNYKNGWVYYRFYNNLKLNLLRFNSILLYFISICNSFLA